MRDDSKKVNMFKPINRQIDKKYDWLVQKSSKFKKEEIEEKFVMLKEKCHEYKRPINNVLKEIKIDGQYVCVKCQKSKNFFVLTPSLLILCESCFEQIMSKNDICCSCSE